MVSIRGAVTVAEDTKAEVLKNTSLLLNEIFIKNNLALDDIISIIFTCTNDISSAYPAQSARDMGILNAGLLCMNEMYVSGSLPKCIRVLVFANMDIPQNHVKHVYMGGAAILRPDLLEK